MRLPNGYGSVYKLSGKRRKPWGVRKTIGWEIDESTGKTKQLFENIGYYATQKEALQVLAAYNENPYDLNVGKITFSEVFERWSEEKFAKVSKSNINGYNAAYKVCESLYDIRFADIKKAHLQNVIDTCGKNYPTLRKVKVFFNQIFKYALENDIISKDYSQFIEITHHKKKEDSSSREPFSKVEIEMLWENVKRNEYTQIILMLIYSGVRISELLDLKKDHVNIEERYFDIVASKTQAGIRRVPIALKTLDYFKYWMEKNDCDHLISTPNGEPFLYRNYYDSYWKPFMKELGMNHRPHDTRHTTISLLAAKNTNQTIIKKIAGHAGAMTLTEKVYTHFEIQELIDAIDLI